MRKLLVALAVLVAVVVAAGFLLPSLIDAGAYRAELASRLSAAVGRDVTIDGSVEFVLLPSPRVQAFDVRASEASGQPAFSARRVELALGWGSLFGKSVEIHHLRLIEPSLVLPVPPGEEMPALPELGQVTAVRIERTDIQNGRIVWTVPKSAVPRTIEQIQASIVASPLASSVRIRGTAVASAVPLEFDAVVADAPAGRPVPVSLTATVRPSLARVALRGTYDKGAGVLRARLQLEGGDLLSALNVVAGVPVDSMLAGPASQAFSAAGDLVWSATGLAANDLVLELGDLRATGAASIVLDHAPAVDVALAMTWLDLDRLSKLERPAEQPARPAGQPAEGVVARLDGVLQRHRVPLEALDLNLDLGIEAVGINGGVIRQVHLNAVMSRGDLVVNQASALLPGGTELTGFAQIGIGASPLGIEGTISARSDNLRGLLEWLEVDTGGVPAGRLRRFEGQARMRGTLARIELTDLSLAFDSTRATGGVAVAVGPRVGLGVDLEFDQINLDAYAAPANATGPTESSGLALGAALLDRFDANLTLSAGTVTVAGQPLSGVAFDGTLHRGDLALRRFDIRDLAGASVEARGRISDVASQPGPDLELTLRAEDASRLLRLAGLVAPVPARLDMSGRLRTAPGDGFRIEDLRLDYGGTRLEGSARLPEGPPRLAIELASERVRIDGLPRIAAGDGLIGVDVKLAAAALSYGPREIADARLEAHIDDGGLTAMDIDGDLYGGELDFTLRSEGPDRGKLAGTATVRNADLARILEAAVNVEGISGRGDVRAAFSIPARWNAENWSGLSGAIEVRSGEGAIEGLDLALMRDMLEPGDPPTDIAGLLGAGLSGGATPFTALDLAASVQNEVLRLETLKIVTAGGEATGDGSADLARGTLDIHLALPLGSGPQVPPLRLVVSGGVEEPRVAIDAAELQRYLERRHAETPGHPQGSPIR